MLEGRRENIIAGGLTHACMTWFRNIFKYQGQKPTSGQVNILSRTFSVMALYLYKISAKKNPAHYCIFLHINVNQQQIFSSAG